MKNENYEKKYYNLKKEYEDLEKSFKIINDELYKEKSSRLYKFIKFIRKMLIPFRKIIIKIKNSGNKSFKINKFLRKTDKLVIIPSSFEFDEFVNQRPINYSKYLSNKGYKVLFIVWQWNESTKVNNAYKEVFKNIFQIPLYNFLNNDYDFSKIYKKVFYITFPQKKFHELSYEYRKHGFIIHYDIMDEWEEFNKVGQAPWYIRDVEEQLILESDFVCAVSPSLIEKFKSLRSDISLSPNGFYKNVTGESNKNISLTTVKNNIINIGYFGHLTDSWFDWDLIFDVAENNKNFVFHIIGYGLSSETEEKFKKYPNIHFYGKVQTNLLHEYVREWNIGIIHFKDSILAQAVDPIKIYEYLYMGLPVIVTGILHLKSYPKTHVVKDAKEFVKCVNKLIQNKNETNIDEFLENSTWESRFDKFLDIYSIPTIGDLYEK